ncbi:MAG TPA: hypothetical protein DIW23_07300 [Anaerolineae bacterium]|nr:hypothetical protein [Anaerolineae bacterium]
MSLSQNKTMRFFEIGAEIFFALTIIFLPFRWRIDVWVRPMPPLYSDYTNFQLFLTDITLIYLLIFWFALLIIQPRKLNAGNALIFICLIGLTVSGIISVFGSVDSILSRYHVFRFILLLLFYLYIVNELQSPLWVIVPIALQIIIQAPVAIGQSLAQSSLGLQTFGEIFLDPQILGTSIIPIDGIRFLRAYGLSDHPNILGGAIAFSLIILFAVVLYGKNRQPLFSSILFLIAFPALIMTFSRSAWLSFGLVTSFMVACEAFAQKWDSVKRASLLGMLSLVVILPILFQQTSAFEKRVNAGNVINDATMQQRDYLLEVGNTLFVEHFARGIGLSATPLALKERFENFPANYQPPHYVPLLVAIETGVLGGMFYLILFLMPFVLFILKWKTYIHQPYVMASLALIFAISIVSLFDYYTWYVTGRVWHWLAWGIFSLALQKANE